MKRDMDLARKILLMIEDCLEPTFAQAQEAEPEDDDDDDVPTGRLRVEGYDGDLVSYHVMILKQAGLITANDASDSSGIDWRPVSLNSEGHEFLEAAREPSRWEKAKNHIKEKTGSLSFDLMKTVLFQLAKDAI